MLPASTSIGAGRSGEEDLMDGSRIRMVLISALMALSLISCSGNELQALNPTTSQSAAATPAGATIPPAAAVTQAAAPDVPVATLSTQVTPVPSSASEGLSPSEQNIAAIFERAAPAVVRIDVTTNQGQAIGSGFLVSIANKPYIITNNHVAGGGGQLLVSFTNLFQSIGHLVGTDPDSDIAVVQVDDVPQGLTPLDLGMSSQVVVGQQVIAIGNPLAQDRTVTSGIVSAIGRTISESEASYSIGGAIQTDAP